MRLVTSGMHESKRGGGSGALAANTPSGMPTPTLSGAYGTGDGQEALSMVRMGRSTE